MSEYRRWENGELIHVYDLEDCFKAIRARDTDNEKRIKFLEEANKKLKDEAYKDKELQNMKEQLEEMKADYYRGFPITERESAAIKLWKKKHEEEAHKGRYGHYSYHFYPTGLGTSGIIRCSCGAEFEFQEIG